MVRQRNAWTHPAAQAMHAIALKIRPLPFGATPRCHYNRPMTLARRMMIATSALVLSLLVISIAALWGLAGVGGDLDVALHEYQKLRAVLEIGPNLARARAMLEGGELADPRVFRELQGASIKLSLLLGNDEVNNARLTALRDLLQRLEADDYDIKPPTVDEQVSVINSVNGFLAKLASQTNEVITLTQQAATAKRRATFAIVSVLAGGVTLAAFGVAVWQYRSVMRPLATLRRGVKTIAGGRFTDRLDPAGDREFAELAGDFNQMAAQLDDFYRELEAKVAAKSKELVRSERLASVGFLAAGVAHEINNPLGIMSGYAELSLRKLKNNVEGAKDHAAHSLEIICDEAMRCKKIIQKLLSLVRGGQAGAGGDERKERVPIAQVVSDVADIVQGLPRYRERKIETKVAPPDSAGPRALAVMGHETELKQVLLNLVINALEAVDARTGRVIIEAQQEGDRLILSVTDNGKGMSPATLDHVFEPFFTEKRGVPADGEERGTGLGLSITHAIVVQHGGRIRAASEGADKGSRFTVELPAA
jgi:signal transduction histidine kinase